MIVYLVWAVDIHSYHETEYMEEIFSTIEKAEAYIDSIDEIDKEAYGYYIEKREVC